MRYEVHVSRYHVGQDEAREPIKHTVHKAREEYREIETGEVQEHVGDEVREV